MYKYLNQLYSKEQPYLHIGIGNKNEVYSLQWIFNHELNNNNIVFRTCRGNKMQDKLGLFNEFGAVFQFPNYFGENWDAFEECLRDLSWLNYEAIVLVITDTENLLLNAVSKDFCILVEILNGVTMRKNVNSIKPFHTIFQVDNNLVSQISKNISTCINSNCFDVFTIKDYIK